MDLNVEKIKNLLEDGYKIVRHQLQYKNNTGQNIIENEVTLQKESNTVIIHSIDSPEFLQFISHFKRAKDKYDNAEFIYVKDLDRYNQMVEKQQNQVALRDHHRLSISGREFSEGIITTYFQPGEPGKSLGLANFWIDLDQNPDFKNVDFKDEIVVYDKSNSPVFRGFVKNYEYSDQNGFILAQDMSLKMDIKKVSVEFNKMNSVDCVGLLTESAGFKFRPHGIPYNTIERDFIVIIPVQNMIIDQSFRIGDVEFYQEFESLDDSLIRKSNTGRNNSLWNGNFPRARVTVKAKQFFQAISKGFSSISKAVDIIALRTDMSFPTLLINDDSVKFQFSYYKHLSKVKIPSWVYCREKDSEAHTFFNTESIIENLLSIEVDPQNFFEDVNKLCSDLIIKDNPTADEENLLQVLHWLRKSIQEDNNKDKFISLWIGFEFLISGVKTASMFTEKEISDLIKIMDDTGYDINKKDAIKSKLKMLNEPPLMEKFSHLKNSLGVDLSDWELSILRAARKKRTDLIHGRKDVDIQDEELNKMRTILEKMLIKKLDFIKRDRLSDNS